MIRRAIFSVWVEADSFLQVGALQRAWEHLQRNISSEGDTRLHLEPMRFENVDENSASSAVDFSKHISHI